MFGQIRVRAGGHERWRFLALEISRCWGVQLRNGILCIISQINVFYFFSLSLSSASLPTHIHLHIHTMSLSDLAETPQSRDGTSTPGAISLTVPTNLIMLPAAAALVGLSIGFIRGGSRARLRFLVENAHRKPKTVQGWVRRFRSSPICVKSSNCELT